MKNEVKNGNDYTQFYPFKPNFASWVFNFYLFVTRFSDKSLLRCLKITLCCLEILFRYMYKKKLTKSCVKHAQIDNYFTTSTKARQKNVNEINKPDTQKSR